LVRRDPRELWGEKQTKKKYPEGGAQKRKEWRPGKVKNPETLREKHLKKGEEKVGSGRRKVSDG